MSSDADATDVEERIRRSLHETAERVTFADDLAPDPSLAEHRNPARTVAVAAIAAACVVSLAVGVGVAVQRGSRRSPGVGNAPTSVSAAPTTPPTTTPDPKSVGALEAWSHFPVDAQPRPIVLIGESVDGPDRGFTNPDIRIADAEKEAFDAGAMSTPASFPPGPPSADGIPIIGAAAAFDRLRATGSGTASTELQTTDVRLGTGSFLTDRGWRTLPAWLFSFRDVEDPVAVLATAPAASFPSPNGNTPPAQLGAKTTAGSRTVELTFVGPKEESGPCGAQYEAHVTESSVAVAVSVSVVPPAVTTTTTSSPSVIMGCVDIGYSRHVTITLREPLGARVLVDDTTNSAVAVDS
jgi:hypothetical protein